MNEQTPLLQCYITVFLTVTQKVEYALGTEQIEWRKKHISYSWQRKSIVLSESQHHA